MQTESQNKTITINNSNCCNRNPYPTKHSLCIKYNNFTRLNQSLIHLPPP